VAALVESLPKWRDGVLVLAGLAYVLGYLSWAIYSSENGIGLSVVLDAQYFSAGIFPAIIVIAACLLAWWLRWLARWVRRPLPDSGRTVKTILDAVAFLCIVTGFALLFLMKNGATVPGLIIFAGVVAALVSSFFSREKTDRWYHRFVLGLGWLYLPLVAVIAFSFYTTRMFPDLPHAFGGPRPQCIQLDVDAAKLSANTLQLLRPRGQPDQTHQPGIMRSGNLYLIFQSSEHLFLQTSRQTSRTNRQVFRLNSSAVEGLFAVADESPTRPDAESKMTP
jgi:hypothetical protein